MTAKKKVLAKNKTELADVLNLLDGKRQGVSRDSLRKALQLVLTVEIAAIRSKKYKSVCLMMRAQARKKAAKMKPLKTVKEDPRQLKFGI